MVETACTRSACCVRMLCLSAAIWHGEGYGEGYGIIRGDARAELANRSVAENGAGLAFLNPANCASLPLAGRNAQLDVPIELRLWPGESTAADMPCARVQVRSSTAHTWYFMTPPPASTDTAVVLCPPRGVRRFSITLSGTVQLGRGYHRLSAYLVERDGALVAELPRLRQHPEAAGPLTGRGVQKCGADHMQRSSVDGGDAQVPHAYLSVLPQDGQASELHDLRAHASASRRSKAKELSDQRTVWRQLSQVYDTEVRALGASVARREEHQRRHGAHAWLYADGRVLCAVLCDFGCAFFFFATD